jgi:hypothetical protein
LLPSLPLVNVARLVEQQIDMQGPTPDAYQPRQHHADEDPTERARLVEGNSFD